MSKELTSLLDDFLDNPDDIELKDSMIEAVKSRTMYSFISVLYYISYPRIHELIECVCALIKPMNIK